MERSRNLKSRSRDPGHAHFGGHSSFLVVTVKELLKIDVLSPKFPRLRNDLLCIEWDVKLY